MNTLTAQKLTSRKELEKLRSSIIERTPKDQLTISVCGGTGCLACGCKKVGNAFKEAIASLGLGSNVDLKITGCPGFCERGPLVVILPKEIFYQRVKPEDVDDIISKTITNDEIVERLLYKDPVDEKKVVFANDLPFYKSQERVILGNNDKIVPTNILDYITLDGYSALGKVLFDMDPEQAIEEVKKSGLRGRGGAGFPTGIKWELCRKSEGHKKYIVCNADEGDPGAFMDRAILEGNPHLVLEGMIIGAYAIGANEAYAYVRSEYPLAIDNLKVAISQAEEYGLLGENILNSGFNLTVNIADLLLR